MNKKSAKYYLISCASIVSVILGWHLAVVLLEIRPTVFPGPVTIFNTFITKLYTRAPDGATLIEHLIASLQVTFLGYGLGISVGVPLGIAMAWNKWIDKFVRPLFDLIRPVPGIAWIPMFILLFGIGITPRAMVIFISAMAASLINSYTGIKQTKEVHLWVGDVFGATSLQKLFRIAIPTSLPMIFTGLRVAMGASWAALVAAELLASMRGLGFMIQQARTITRPDLIIVGILVIGAVGAVLDAILRWIELKVAKGMNAG